MNYITSNILVSLAFLLMFSSCNYYYYAPDEGHLMNLSEKGDIKISGGIGDTNDDDDNNFNLQAGYSPIKHLGLQASHFELKINRGNPDNFTPRGNGHITSGAIGTYYFFENKKQKKSFLPPHLIMKKGLLLDLYFGYGQGAVQNFYENGAYSHFEFQKSYIQFGFHWQHKMFGIDWVLKPIKLDYKKGIVLKEVEPDHLEGIRDLSNNNPFSFIEQSFRLHLGLRQFRFYASTSWINKDPENIGLNFIESTHHLGLIIEIDEIFRKRK